MIELSVVIPVYKIPDDLLKKCIASVFSQKGYNEDGIEIILVDDGSPDDCGKICDCYAGKYKYVRAVHKENGGLSSARNYGKKFARGKYITFLDADDWVTPEYYKTIIDYMKMHDADIGIGGMCTDDGLNINIIGKKSKKKLLNTKDAIVDMYTENGFIWSVCDKVYRRDFLFELEFDESILYGEDSLFSYQSFKKAKKIAFVPVYGYHYYMRTDSMTHSFSKNRFALMKIYDYVYNDAKKEYPQIQSIVLDFYLKILLGLLSSLRKDKKNIRNIYEGKITYIIKKYFYRAFLPSEVLSIKERLKIILGILPRSINDSVWYVFSMIKGEIAK